LAKTVQQGFCLSLVLDETLVRAIEKGAFVRIRKQYDFSIHLFR
jgi:hypothetical protein